MSKFKKSDGFVSFDMHTGLYSVTAYDAGKLRFIGTRGNYHEACDFKKEMEKQFRKKNLAKRKAAELRKELRAKSKPD